MAMTILRTDIARGYGIDGHPLLGDLQGEGLVKPCIPALAAEWLVWLNAFLVLLTDETLMTVPTCARSCRP